MSRGRILVIDDKPNMLKLIARMLGGEYEVETVNDPIEGVQKVRAMPFDVVVTDVRMPGMSGMEVLEEVKSVRPDTQVIVMTAYGEISQAVNAVKMGAYDYITKPFDPPEILKQTIDRALEHSRVVQQAQPIGPVQAKEGSKFENIVGESPAMMRVYRLVERAAGSDTTVLLEGDSGTGKELFARAIHAHSSRKDRKFVAVNCAAVATQLIESELFGHVKGAFTGAVAGKAGLFEVADGGTIFLDEIGELELGVQAKINRVLQEHEIRPVGATEDKIVDVRVIAATNVNLRQAVSEGRFREDLYYRLNVFPIRIPPLRERREDIPLLVAHFIQLANRNESKNVTGIDPEALSALMQYDWPGNVRELENVINRAVLLCDGPTITRDIVIASLPALESGGGPVTTTTAPVIADLPYKEAMDIATSNIQEQYVRALLRKYNGNVTQAAQHAGIERRSLHRLMSKFGIRSDEFREK